LTSLLPHARVGAQTPRVAKYPPYRTTAAEEVIDLAHAAGLVLDPWQQFVLRHGLGELDNGQWAAFMVSLWVARQNGKGGVIEALELAWLFLFGERLVLHSAHEYKTAQEAFLRIKGLIQNTPDFDRLVNRYWQANGEQGIELVGGARLRFVARSHTSGRGFSGDKNVLDEGQELTVEQMAALLPTMSARPNPQLWIFGTPPEDPAAWCYTVRASGEAGSDPRAAYFDWGAGTFNPADPEDVAKLDDLDLRYQTNPAMGIRITEQFVETERTLLKEKFAHERLGMWLPRAAAGSGVIPEDLWRRLAAPGTDRPDDVAFALHVNLLRTHAAIAYAGRRPDGLTQVGIVDYRPGVSWVFDRIIALKERWNPVAIGVDTRSENLLLDLAKAGIKPPEDDEHPVRADLAVPGAAEVAAGFGLFVDDCRRERIRHLDEGPLNAAIAGANTRPLSGGLTWDHKSPVEVSPLVAVTLAVWAYETRAHLVVHEYDPLDNIW
jgi:hypothetical protein